ncbi:MAG: hypothetical protein NVSMB52_02660 [Chloroflexota bacterium]
MNTATVVTHIYLPLLTQETGVMVSTFTYGLRAGIGAPMIVLANTIAVVTDLALFFLPTYFLSNNLHNVLERRFADRYQQGSRMVQRVGAFPAATAIAFVMPSVAAMVVVGLLRLDFRQALAGLFLGSAVYVVVPLALAEPLSKVIPSAIVPFLVWIGPGLAVTIVVALLFRFLYTRLQHAT